VDLHESECVIGYGNPLLCTEVVTSWEERRE